MTSQPQPAGDDYLINDRRNPNYVQNKMIGNYLKGHKPAATVQPDENIETDLRKLTKNGYTFKFNELASYIATAVTEAQVGLIERLKEKAEGVFEWPSEDSGSAQAVFVSVLDAELRKLQPHLSKTTCEICGTSPATYGPEHYKLCQEHFEDWGKK